MDNRLCELCDLGEVEGETHFVLCYPYCDDFRMSILYYIYIYVCTDEDGMEGLFSFTAYKLASFIFGTNARSTFVEFCCSLCHMSFCSSALWFDCFGCLASPFELDIFMHETIIKVKSN